MVVAYGSASGLGLRAISVALARSVSLLGHPLVVVPGAVALLLLHGRGKLGVPVPATLGAIAGAVLLFSFWQVRRGRWQHVDASVPHERRSLNLFLAGILLSAGLAAFARVPERGLGWGLLFSGLLVLAVMSISRWMKPSLHAAFAAFAVLLVAPVRFWYLGCGILLAAAICFSRVLLGRHSVSEVMAGALLGCCAGGLFWLAVEWTPGLR